MSDIMFGEQHRLERMLRERDAEIEHLRITINEQAKTITALLREIDVLQTKPPIVRHDTDTRP